VEAALVLPLVLPPTVLGFYLLAAMGPGSSAGRLWQALFGEGLVFSFSGLVAASLIVNLPFAVQPAQRAFAAIPASLMEASATLGHSRWRSFARIALPLAWPGVVSGLVLSFAHTLGEFGVVLMVGGAIPGRTRTLALSIYDRVEALDMAGAATQAGVLLAISFAAVVLITLLGRRRG
jgi:molybdate transport system permease protein